MITESEALSLVLLGRDFIVEQGEPSVRFSVESEAKKKEGVSQQLCLAGQKGDTPCHLRAPD